MFVEAALDGGVFEEREGETAGQGEGEEPVVGAVGCYDPGPFLELGQAGCWVRLEGVEGREGVRWREGESGGGGGAAACVGNWHILRRRVRRRFGHGGGFMRGGDGGGTAHFLKEDGFFARGKRSCRQASVSICTRRKLEALIRAGAAASPKRRESS